MTETLSQNCNYTIQPFPEDEPLECGKVAVREVTSQVFDMRYCSKHWRQVQDLPQFKQTGVTITDLAEAYDC